MRRIAATQACTKEVRPSFPIGIRINCAGRYTIILEVSSSNIRTRDVVIDLSRFRNYRAYSRALP